MTSTYTPNRVYEKQGTGDNPNTWGTRLNTNVFDIIDANLGATLAISVAGSSNVSLTQTQANNLIHTLTGILTGNISYIFPTSQGGFYRINNNTTGSFSLTVAPSLGTGVVIPQGSSALVFIDGTTNVASLVGPPLTIPASAVNYPSISASATGNAVSITATGTDTNIDFTITTKGTGVLNTQAINVTGSTNVPNCGLYRPLANTPTITVNGNKAMSWEAGGSANYLRVFNAATLNRPGFLSAGTDTNVGIFYATQGTGDHEFDTNSNARQFRITHTASAVNNLAITGGAAGAPGTVTLSAEGSSTDVDIAITPKGAGVLKFGTRTAIAAETVTGYITVKDSGGTSRKLAVVS